METNPESGAICQACQAPLSADGTCVPCLLRAGLHETLAEEQPRSFAPPFVFGDFEVARREDGSLWELGRGAMGVTYRAVDRVLHRHVALKVIQATRASDTQAVRERFLREARAAAALRHPNVAGVFQFGASSAAGPCYYAMELVEGETLEHRLRRDGPFAVETALEIAEQVTAALVAAALRGLVHRDLKPGNLMLSGGEGTGLPLEVKVIDFGLAKAAAATTGETDLTRGGFIGTPAFASPEQFDLVPVDARADIYALGVTLWYALTGKLPYAGRTITELRDLQARTVLPIEQLTARKVPPPLVALLRAMLAEDREERPASARHLANALETCRRQLGLSAKRGFSQRAWYRAARRRPAVATVAVVGLGAALWWAAVHLDAFRRADAAGPPDKSIAVLPFANLSRDNDNAFFTEGVQDEILTDLARVADLKVISRTSVLPYQSGAPRKNLREISRELGVANILEGSVQRLHNRVRVSAQLIDARTDTHLWAEHFDRDLSDVFAIQSEIAQAIAAQLQARLSPGEREAIETRPTKDVAAYDAYLQGNKLLRAAELTKEEAQLRQAARQLEEATTDDARFFEAWCALSRAHLNLYWFNFDNAPERLALAETAAETARRLRPEAGESHLVEGMVLYMGHHDFPGALAEFQAAAKLLPNSSEAPYWLGLVLRRQGRWAESIRQLERAHELDPRNAFLLTELADTDQYVYRYAAAGQANDAAVALDPHNLDYAYWKAACARWERADLAPTRQWLRLLPADSEKWSDTAALVAANLALDDGDYATAAQALARYRPETISDADFIYPRTELAGWIAFLGGDKEGAKSAFEAARERTEAIVRARPQDAKALLVLARIHAELGLKADAIREGLQASAMLPVSADAIDGPYILRELAGIYAQSGEPDRALETLRSIVGQPAGPSYGHLRLEHEWDPLRREPRFQALVAAALHASDSK